MYDKVKRETMVKTYFGCNNEDIASIVILTPVWRLENFASRADEVSAEFAGWYKGVTLKFGGKSITVISSGIGAPRSGDCALALSYTDCDTVIFSGSAGAVS
ncbi:MAG TPA: hypothetical protein PL076_11705, partial [Bacillota bacterium]|nr:hypothetical protein [Bacillota bacterium]